MTHSNVNILEKNTLYQGFAKISSYRLRYRQFSGEWTPILNREVVVRNPVAGVLPYDPILDRVLLIEQFRIGAIKEKNPWLLELIAGYIEPNETAADMAYREAKEEANLILKALVPIYHYWTSPGNSSGYVSLYCACVDTSSAGGIYGLNTESEDIRVRVFETEEAFFKMKSGEINNAMAIIGLQWLALHHLDIQKKFRDL